MREKVHNQALTPELSMSEKREITGEFYEGLFGHITGAKSQPKGFSFDLIHHGTSLAMEVKGMGHSNSFSLKQSQLIENQINFRPNGPTLASDGFYGLCSYKSRQTSEPRTSLLVGSRNRYEVYDRLAKNTERIYIIGIGVVEMILENLPVVQLECPSTYLPGFNSLMDKGVQVPALRLPRRYLDSLVGYYSSNTVGGPDRIYAFTDRYAFLFLDEYIVECEISVLAADEKKLGLYKQVLRHQSQPRRD